MNKKFIIKPDIKNQKLTKNISGIDHTGAHYKQKVVMEKPLTIFLNNQEIVTCMTVGDKPDWLALGFLINQGMITKSDKIISVDVDWEIETAVVRTDKVTNYEEKIKKKIRTSGCGVGTIFSDVMDNFDQIKLNKEAIIKISWLPKLLKSINTQPSLYLEAGAIHGCVLCIEDKPIIYVEDVGRHNALDKIAGWLWNNDCLLYTSDAADE